MNRLFAWLAAGGIAGGLLLGALPAEAKESSRRFYDALRQHGYFEQALDYLDEVRDSGGGEAGFREVLDYEAGLTLIDLGHAAPLGGRGRKAPRPRRPSPGPLPGRAFPPRPGGGGQDAVGGRAGRAGPPQGRTGPLLRPPRRQQSVESVRGLYRQAETAFLASEKQFEDVLAKLPRFLDPNDPNEAPRNPAARASAAGLAARPGWPWRGSARRSARRIPRHGGKPGRPPRGGP